MKIKKYQKPSDNLPKGGKAYYVTYPGYRAKDDSSGMTLPTGHAGILLISPTGSTKYYEYGRYSQNDPKKYGISNGNPGIVRKITIPDYNGTNLSNIINVLKKSEVQNEGNKVRLSEIPNIDFNKAIEYVNSFANNPDRPSYNLLFRNCGSFADDVINASYKGEQSLPGVVLLRTPVNYSRIYSSNGFETKEYKKGGILKRK